MRKKTKNPFMVSSNPFLIYKSPYKDKEEESLIYNKLNRVSTLHFCEKPLYRTFTPEKKIVEAVEDRTISLKKVKDFNNFEKFIEINSRYKSTVPNKQIKQIQNPFHRKRLLSTQKQPQTLNRNHINSFSVNKLAKYHSNTLYSSVINPQQFNLSTYSPGDNIYQPAKYYANLYMVPHTIKLSLPKNKTKESDQNQRKVQRNMVPNMFESCKEMIEIRNKNYHRNVTYKI